MLRPLLDNGVPRGTPSRSNTRRLMRYAAQSDATAVPFTLPLDPAVAASRDFHARHRELYGYATDEPVVIESLRVQSRMPSTCAPATTRQASRARRQHGSVRSRGEARPTAMLDRAGLRRVTGPAIIADAWSTVVVPPGWQAAATAGGTLVHLPSASPP